jgi:hypothetical protein
VGIVGNIAGILGISLDIVGILGMLGSVLPSLEIFALFWAIFFSLPLAQFFMTLRLFETAF